MQPLTVILVIAGYFAAMLLASRASRRGGNAAFFGTRSSSWWTVALAMIGASMSGVTYVSVPGMVGTKAFGYLQMCLGFFAGYLVIAFVLTPLFYRMNAVSVYQYLERRFGTASYKTGAWFFFLSKMTGASVRLFLVCVTMQVLVFGPLGLPFLLNVLVSIAIVLLYTLRGGVRSVLANDILKTVCMVLSVVLCIVFIARSLGLDGAGLVSAIRDSDQSRVWFFDNVNTPNYFWKQFLGGFFTVIAMTGLDQDMMQRTLSCKNPRESQKNLITSSILQIVVIFLFLCLGVLLYRFAAENGISQTGDELFPAVAASGRLPGIVGILFVLGLVSCAWSAAGSALTALTTSFTIDILGTAGKTERQVTRTRQWVHAGMAAGMALCILLLERLTSESTIHIVYTLASYTYGPILGLFAFGIAVKRPVRDRWVPLVALLAPLLCLVLQTGAPHWFGGYRFGYEILPLNAAFTFLGLCLLIRRRKA